MDIPRFEALHDLILHFGRHPTVDQFYHIFLEGLVLQILVQTLGIQQGHFLAFFHQRAHKIGLPPFQQLFMHITQHGVQLAITADEGDYRFTVGRHFIDLTHLQIAIDRHRQRPGYGCGRKIQEVWMSGMSGQARALLHSEAVLLVHSHKTQPAILHILLDQGMRADDDLTAMFPDLFLLLSLPFVRPAFEQDHGNLHAFHQLGDILIVLFCQDLCGCHQCRLIAIFDGQQHGKKGHDRLAATHVALHQTGHLELRTHIGKDIFDYSHLGFGELKR